MKKLKIKVIESGRILTPEEFQELKGGLGCNTYENCGWFSYESCKPAAAYGYESNGSTILCTVSNHYASCGRGNNYTICGAGKTYRS